MTDEFNNMKSEQFIAMSCIKQKKCFKTESTRKLSNFNLKTVAFFFTFLKV